MRPQTRLVRFVLASFGVLALWASVSAQIAVVHLADDSVLDANSPPPQGRLPVLFVHGHNAEQAFDSDFNYKKNWQETLNGLPSFKQTLELAENSGLGIEPYYIRFIDQNRSIVEDAFEIRNAVERILTRHDPNYPAQPTNVQVVIIAFSKGTISARLYLKNLETEQRSFHPVSEFIAIAPPNHGINVAGLEAFTSTAIQQLLNGYGATTCLPFSPSTSTLDFIQNLNGHPIADTLVANPAAIHATEAPNSRSDLDANGGPVPPNQGTLYVTTFADGNRDFVGGDTVPANNDCQGRRFAKNLSPNAINIPVAAITGTDAASVHRNTVHTPEVMCLALYAAAHHRSPVGQTCNLVDGKPVIPPVPRAAAMLTLDFSGSMGQEACPGCVTRAEVLKDSVELFVQLWSAVSVPSDRIGVTYFSRNVSSFPTSGDPLPLLNDAAAGVIADVSAQVPLDATTIGGGLQRSINELNGVSTETPIRRIILFTDGMQNFNPMVLNINNQLMIDNNPGVTSNIAPTSPPTVLNQALGIAVDTIGVGASEDFVGLLQDISNATRGRTWVTTTPNDDLRRFFVEELINALKGFSPQLVAYRHGTIGATGSRETFAIEDNVKKLVLKVSWKRGASMTFRVTKDGVDVTSGGRFINGPFYKIFVIDLPKRSINARGNWQVRISGKARTRYETAAIVDGSRINYDALFETKTGRVGAPLDLIVRLTRGKLPMRPGTRVNIQLLSPTMDAKQIAATIPTRNLPNFEPGLSIDQRRMLRVSSDPTKWRALKWRRQILTVRPNDKGEFRTQFTPRTPGIHTVLITIEGDDPRLGRFSRALSVTTAVRRP